MNLPYLLLNINALHLLQLRRIASTNIRLPVIGGRSLLAARGFLLADGLARDAVEDVAALRGEALEVVGDVEGGEVCGRVARVGFGFLFAPAGVEEFDYG